MKSDWMKEAGVVSIERGNRTVRSDHAEWLNIGKQ